jgi:N-acetylglucosaminyldiphosphoundecaprenol N-acetyl-beta-D-mannosaminyltransferase
VRTFDGFDELDAAVHFASEQSIDIVICAMGCGAQEDFLLRLQESGWTGCGFTCGGYFDQLGNGLRYYPEWIDKNHLRWLYRLYQEPGRLWKRYAVQYSLFCLLLLKDYMPESISISRGLSSHPALGSRRRGPDRGLEESGS